MGTIRLSNLSFGSVDTHWFGSTAQTVWKLGPEMYDKSHLMDQGTTLAVPLAVEYPKCCVCGEEVRALHMGDRCQICGGVYHTYGCGISTLSSFTCKACMVSGRMPAGFGSPDG